jgi:hypothetical protein
MIKRCTQTQSHLVMPPFQIRLGFAYFFLEPCILYSLGQQNLSHLRTRSRRPLDNMSLCILSGQENSCEGDIPIFSVKSGKPRHLHFGILCVCMLGRVAANFIRSKQTLHLTRTLSTYARSPPPDNLFTSKIYTTPSPSRFQGTTGFSWLLSSCVPISLFSAAGVRIFPPFDLSSTPHNNHPQLLLHSSNSSSLLLRLFLHNPHHPTAASSRFTTRLFNLSDLRCQDGSPLSRSLAEVSS